ncbi:hypothetical protein DEI92_05000 [Curtobacterium sp. MCBD17_034]|uniref:hypothetical protein n=1 Tax=unclassified Curtobacterium TaxID=257496 RepID=UPI000DAAC675|nr:MULTISPECIES: hypothetical protein [unclassified Curtobacterium]PZF60981.1 hypothetical protein DEI92_05000 [Curtobacterium sp. MCBD17_034]PZM40331.1 hypothetical protein DEI90_01235 [Curtobacterium sp. MCBD17_031]
MDTALISFGAALLGAVSGFAANLYLAQRDRRLNAREAIYYQHLNSIYDDVWKARARALRGRRTCRRVINRFERVTRLIEMESRRTRRAADLTAAQELHDAMRSIWFQAARHSASVTAWDRVANAMLRLNDDIGDRLNE